MLKVCYKGALKPLDKVRVTTTSTRSCGPTRHNQNNWIPSNAPRKAFGHSEKPHSMLTFTPLSGAATSERTSPLAYLLQVDDINILLDCGSPDWCPEPTSSENGGENKFPWEQY